MSSSADQYDEPLFYQVMQYARTADRDVVDMVSGNPDWEPPRALRAGLTAYADADVDKFQYPPSEGLTRLRESICEQRSIDISRVLITHGAAEANYLAMATALESYSGQEFVVVDPVYPYYPGKATMLGGTVTRVPVRKDGHLDVDAMQEAITNDTVAVICNTPNNPTGAVYKQSSLQSLAEFASTVDAALIIDEVYARFDFTGQFKTALTLAADNVIVTTAFSKSMAITGFRIGYAVFPSHLVDQAATRHMLVMVSASRPAQAAVAAALKQTGSNYYEETRAMLRHRVQSFIEGLETAGASYIRPEGAFYVLARFDGFSGTLRNVKRLIDEAGVAGMPGAAFGSSYDEWMRFSLCTDRTATAGDRLAAFFTDLTA
ncbi:MAG: aspartate/tyrosine/aromatic aminotransferase [Haloquadratum sp. J07HQX50]|jgi:Aspartate/tyrosine/aromatic aminotransferase|nr:MAG: aspartate/tyrosine/aromatic aminotransferase [Haloquadratum sp. J07HQX50]